MYMKRETTAKIEFITKQKLSVVQTTYQISAAETAKLFQFCEKYS